MNTHDKEFLEKVVLITGASSEVGAAIAIYFAKHGAKLALTDRSLENLQNIAARCSEENDWEPFVVQGDILNDDDVKQILDATITHYGRLDVLVNNADVLESGTIEDSSVQQYERIFSVNVRSIYHLTNLAVPHLIASKGNIVNVSSVAGLRAFPGALSYCMSKSAIEQFTKCVALEIASKQVRVNSVNSDVIVTDLYKCSGMNEEQCKAYFDICKTKHTLDRTGQLEEVAEVIGFLASDKATYITGAYIPVDGGKHATCPL